MKKDIAEIIKGMTVILLTAILGLVALACIAKVTVMLFCWVIA